MSNNSESPTATWEPISASEAYHLIRTGQAGHYSAAAARPLAHDKQTCVFAQGQWYLVPSAILQVQCLGPGTDEMGDETIKFGVTGQEDHPVFALLGQDEEKYNADFFARITERMRYSTNVPAVEVTVEVAERD